MASPPGMRVPDEGSCCAKCMYINPETGTTCLNKDYVKSKYKFKKSGDDRFVDGRTGEVVTDPLAFCCNMFDW